MRAFFGGIAEEYPNLAVLLLARGTRVLPCHSHRLLALLQETGLIDDKDAALFIAEMLHDILTEVVAHVIGIPVSVV